MSHSQFHSINLFILRHAWLNLWDKHMTTGRINQVTTFQSAFAATIYSRVTSTRFRGAEFIITFHVWDPSQLNGLWPRVITLHGLIERQTRKWHHLISHSHTFQARSPLSCRRKQRSPTYDGDYRRPMTPERRTDMADLRVASCIRFDHRQATHLLQHRSKHVTKGRPDGFKGKNDTPRASLLRVGFPHSRTHQLDMRQPSHPFNEAYLRGEQIRSLEAPFQPLTQIKTIPHFPVGASNDVSLGLYPFRGTKAPSKKHWSSSSYRLKVPSKQSDSISLGYAPISWQRPRQGNTDPSNSFRLKVPSKQSDKVSLGLHPFRGTKAPSKKHWSPKLVQATLT